MTTATNSTSPPSNRRLLKETYESFALSGAELQGADREKYRALSSELSQLTLNFGQNVLKDTNLFSMMLTEDELDGLPQSVRDAAAALAKSKGKEGYMINLSYPSYSAFMKYSSRRDLREKLYRAYNTRNQSGEYNNIPILKRIAEVRLEIAKLFGKPTFAEYNLQTTMAGNSANVYNLLNQLLDAYKPAALQEVKEIEGFAIGKEGKDMKLMPWDFSYYSEQLKHIKYDLNDEMLRPYFEVNNTIKGVFGLATRLYGLHFTKNPKIPVYHPEVEAFEVTDNDGNYVGVIYTDFFPRETKRAGAWMTEFKGQWKEEDGTDSRPQVTIVMNFSRPTADAPALLTYDEVETFLHEFGHALHGLLSDVTYSTLSGTNVYRDFVELPSQFNENFLSEKEFLDSFAVHYKTGEKMPVELVEKIKESSQYLAAYLCVRQLTFGFLDMAYHTHHRSRRRCRSLRETGRCQNPGIARRRGYPHRASVRDTSSRVVMQPDTTVTNGPRCSTPMPSPCSRLTESSTRPRPLRSATNILKRGGTENPMTLYKRFKGSEPTIEALMRRDGIIK